MVKIALQTLGCKLNQAETESITRQLINCGFKMVDSPEEADVYVLNTCSVTHIADRKARQLLRSVRSSSPDKMIVAMGCYVRRAAEEIRQMGIVDLVLDNEDKGELTKILQGEFGNNGCSTGLITGRTRSLVKIQEGCDEYCSYCIVPYTRGRERSLSQEDVITQIRERIALGYKEVTLTGTKVGAFRQNGSNSFALPKLIETILRETRLKRLRLSSLQPGDLTHELIQLWSDSRLCSHIHIPLQSGCQTILERMGRGYTIDVYEKAMYKVREAVPDLAVTTDILVGFPGEEEKEFEESYNFCKNMGFAGIHVFPYSVRSGTKAAEMLPKVEEKIKKERSRRMLVLARQSASLFRRKFIGRTMNVLWEDRSEQGVWKGMTDNYLRVFTKTDDDLNNSLLPVKLLTENSQGLIGEIADGGKQ